MFVIFINAINDIVRLFVNDLYEHSEAGISFPKLSSVTTMPPTFRPVSYIVCATFSDQCFHNHYI